jgi:hypothetical protein
MNHGKTILAQVLSGLDSKEFARCASKYPTIRETHALGPYDHFAAMVFAQLTYRASLRDIEACLTARPRLLYHSGIRGRVTRSNLSYANENRNWEMFSELVKILMRRAQRLYTGSPLPVDLDGDLFALDATLIDLSLKLFPWARRQIHEAAVKLNILLDLTGDIPCFASIKDGTCPDVFALDEIPYAKGSYYVMDRGYMDLRRLKRIDSLGAWYVIRAKRHMKWYVVESRKVDRATGLRCDQTIRINSAKGKKAYPGELRRVRFKDPKTGLSLVFFTNNFDLDPFTVAEIYKNRWRIEIFFKWIKQNLRLRAFFSRTPNGVRTQIMTALCAYLLVAIAKMELMLPASMQETLQIISISALEKIPLPEMFTNFDTTNAHIDTQMLLAINES